MMDEPNGKETAEKRKEETIPEYFRSRCFWDTDVESLDLEENKYFIIARLYVYGGYLGIDWAERFYTEDDIRETAKRRRDFNPIVANALRKKYHLRKEDMAYYRFEAMGGRETWDH